MIFLYTNIKTIILIVDISYNIHCKKYDPINKKSLNEISQNGLLAIFNRVKSSLKLKKRAE